LAALSISLDTFFQSMSFTRKKCPHCFSSASRAKRTSAT